MFEQSILARENAANRTRALAASFGAQSLVVAVAILIPLIFGDHMPRLQPWITMTIPLRAEPQSQPVKSAAAAPSAPSILRAPSRVLDWHSLNAHRVEPIGATIIGDAEPVLGGDASLPGVPGGLGIAMPLITAAPPSQPRPAATVPKAVDKPRPVGGDVQAAKLIRKIVPEYPPLAKQARVSGTVRLTGVIAKDGTIEQLQVVSGNPLLVPSALAAVKQWLYSPTILDGQPVEVIAPIDVIFILSQ